MGKKRNTKKIVIWITAVVLVLALAAGGFFLFGRSNAAPVNVYPFYYFGMTEYWGDSRESYGPVSTDKIQTVFLSPTQTVTEVLVSQGDTVKKGDLLMTFDTTLSDIALERERLEVEKLKLQLDDARQQLYEINAMKPMVPPTEPDPGQEEENLGMALTEAYLLSPNSEYDGTDPEKAMICWLRADTPIDDALLEAVRLQAEAYRAKNYPEPEVPIEPSEPVDPSEPSEPSEPSKPSEPSEPTDPSDPAGEDGEAPTEPQVPAFDPNVVYVVFKVTEGDMSLAPATTWQGLVLTYAPAAGSYSFRFYDAAGFRDHMTADPSDTEPEVPDIDFGSGFTAAEIAQMRNQQEKVIRDLQFQVKMAEADYKIKQTEVADGKVYAQIDGTVVSLLSPEEAIMTMQPMLKVSGGGGFYVTGTISELELDTLQLGQEVTVNDWNTGMTYTGTVQSLEDYPVTSDYFSGIGNPNVSYYPFTVFIDESADLQEGSYVSVIYSSSAMETGVYLENPFLRTENGETYVYVRGEDGTLEKRTVTTGKSLWGSYTQITEGLTAEDFIAFPYGKEVKAGAPTAEADPSALYEY